MYILQVIFKDGHKYQLALNNNDIARLDISINSTKIDENKMEDYLSLRLCSIQFLIAPMKEILRYELMVCENNQTNINKYKEWWDSKHATND